LDVAATATVLAGQKQDEKLDGVNLLPFLTGENTTAPHDALYWRWRSQTAVLEFPWKLIQLGTNRTYLFDVTQPEGELAANNRLAARPEIAARLASKLQTWSTTLQPPGPPERNNDQDNLFFAAHVDKTIGTVSKRNRAAAGAPRTTTDTAGTLTVKNGALFIMPEAGAKKAAPFLTHAGLDLVGPVTATLRVRAKQGGQSNIAWRTHEQKDFAPENTASFNWPASAEWQQVKVELPVNGRLIHLRISPALGGTALEAQSIELRGLSGRPQSWQFGKAN
jgi:uncharacterized sulfatase